MNGFARCAYRRLELAHVYRDTANELHAEGNNSATAKFFKNKAYYERVRANALLEMLADASCDESIKLQNAGDKQLASPHKTEDLYAAST